MRSRGANGRFIGAARTPLQCEYCGGMFWRRTHGARPDRDARRFCSKRCSGALRTAVADQAHALTRKQAAIEREIARSVRQAVVDQLKAVKAITPPSYKGVHRRERVCHVCPDCGTTFQAPARAVFCSSRCGRRYKQYPRIGAVPVVERNQLASMLSNVRAAQRILWGQ
jgi:hypothetical protein